MIGANVLIFPDSGPEFIRSLRMSTLYAERSYAFTIFDSQQIENLSEICHSVEEAVNHAGYEDIISVPRLIQYSLFVEEHKKDFDLLLKEGLVERCVEDTLNNAYREAQDLAVKQLVERLHVDVEKGNGLKSASEHLLFPLIRAHEKCPPSFFDFLHFSSMVEMSSNDSGGVEIECSAVWKQKIAHYCSFLFYVLSLVYFSENTKIGLLSWSTDYQAALVRLREIFGSEDGLALRNEGEAHLARAVIERHLPLVDDLPFEEILKIRQKRSAEIQAFRSGLAALAAQIDIAQSGASLELQVSDLVVTKVDPALHDLKSAIRSSRIDALTKIGQNYTSLAAATIPATLAYSAGVPINVSAIAATLGAVAGAFIDSSAQQSKLLHANNWSFILRLAKNNRH